MKTLYAATLILSLLGAGAVHAAEPTAQQNKMKTCNADAGDKKGDERKAFMKQCLSAKPAEAAPAPKLTQQEKMKKCNADASAGGKKGDERKAFMKECLSNK
ncbi:PsiF family protein [Duganella callida]|uniref:Phosphate starvation-inducible protein PsiF n=1 Tax=Duganella callida TaxID=2561932 RepID=A0A4Y9SLB4_9BURK|nr:PsiF family protein [Duganella callida]TFW24350.1 phosphate starvation-inducible protein PsiF [Duganella callida]